MQITSPTFAKVAVKPGKKFKWYSEAERQQHCESWRRSGLSMNAYCQQAGVSWTSLSNWARMIRPTSSSAVLPLMDEKKPSVEIILMNGIRIQVTGLSSVGDVVKLLQEVSSCN